MSGKLTEEQLRRIEENKRKALARRAEKLGQTSPLKVNPVYNRPKIGVGTVCGPKHNVGDSLLNTLSVKPVSSSHKGHATESAAAAKSNIDCVGPAGFKQSADQRFDVKSSNNTSQNLNRSSFPMNSSGHSNATKIHVGIAPLTTQSSASSNSARSESGSSCFPGKNVQAQCAVMTEKKELTVQERIEENRRRALEKLAEKKKSPVKVGPSAILNSNSNTTFGGSLSFNSASKSGQGVTVGIQPIKSTSSTSFLNSFNKASADALNHKTPSVNQQPASLSHDRTDNAVQSKSMFLNPSSTSQQPASLAHNKPESTIQSKNIFNGFGGKPVKGSCVLISRERFEVNIGFSAPLVQVFKTMDTKLYDAVTKKWSFKLSEYDKFMSAVKGLQPTVEVEPLPKAILQVFCSQNKGENQGNSIPIADLSNVESSLVNSLMSFQREGVNFGIWKNGRVLIADDMGLGKTIQAICLSCYYRKEWPLLIVVPSSVRFDWAQQFQRWVPGLDPQQINVSVTGKDSCTSGQVNILSYDLMAKKGAELKQKRFQVIIMDECHLLKNSKTARCKAAMPLLQNSRRVILLSGTPALSRPSELYTQICAICPFLFKFHDFGVRYCDGKQHQWGWDYSGSSNMAELQLLLEEKIMIRRLKKDVLTELPDKVRQMVLLDPRSIKVDKDLKNASKVMNSGRLKGMEQRGALLEFFHQSGKAKMAAVKSYVADMLEGDRKFIIFAHHQEVLDGVEDVVREKIGSSYIRIDGRTSSEQRNVFCKKFQLNDDFSVAILSITAANAGLNLSAASLVVFAELFWNPGILVQAEDRAHRIGQQDSVNVHYLVATGTSDDHIWPMIQQKLNVLGKAGLSKDDFSAADTTRVKDRRQEEIIKFLEESFSEDFPTEDVNCNNDRDEGGTSSSGELEPKRKVKTGKQMSITQFCSPVKDIPETSNPHPGTPTKPKGLLSYFSLSKSCDSHMTSEVKGERSEVENNCDNEMDMFDDTDDLFDYLEEPVLKKQRT